MMRVWKRPLEHFSFSFLISRIACTDNLKTVARITTSSPFNDVNEEENCGTEEKKPKTGQTKSALLETVAPRVTSYGNKITVVGIGNVAVACAFCIVAQNITNELALVDEAENKIKGELMDLQHGSEFSRAKITASTDYSITANSRICIITAGARQNVEETRLDLTQRNVDITKKIVCQLIEYSPEAIFIVVSNPVDILTYVAWKVSGFPKNRVIGSGTTLDSLRFSFLIAQKLGVAPINCHGWIIGEHGDSSVPVWSGVNVASINLQQLNPDIGSENDPENWAELHKKVVSAGYEIIKLKGYTCWGIALSVTSLANAILYNTGTVHAVSLHVQGRYGITEDVFLSLPAVLGENGVSDIIKLQLNETEIEALQKSAKCVHDVQAEIEL